MTEEMKVDVLSDISKKSSTGMEPKIAVLIAYLFSWISGLVFYLIEKENKFVKWHAMQSLVLGIIEVIIVIVMTIFGWIPIVGWFFAVICWLALVAAFVFRIIAIVKPFQGQSYRIPGIAKLADKYIKY